MPEGLHQVKIPLPIQHIWDFVSVMDKWAPLVPGYITHEILSPSESTWEFKGDLGLLKKKIKMKVSITNWAEPTKVTFNLEGLNEKFIGNGYFLANKIDDNHTEMAGFLDITANGATAPIQNKLLKSYVPQMSCDLTEAVAENIVQL